MQPVHVLRPFPLREFRLRPRELEVVVELVIEGGLRRSHSLGFEPEARGPATCGVRLQPDPTLVDSRQRNTLDPPAVDADGFECDFELA